MMVVVVATNKQNRSRQTTNGVPFGRAMVVVVAEDKKRTCPRNEIRGTIT
jgi:hypothetical protein